MPVSVELLILFLLLLANGLFAMAETALISSRKARLQQRADEGEKAAGIALAFALKPDRFLSTVQIGITLIGIVAGAFGGATLSAKLAVQLSRIPALSGSANALAFALVVAFITYFSLVIGELVPKNLALRNPESIAIAAVGPMRLLSRIAGPVVWLLTASTSLILRLLGRSGSGDHAVTQEEIEVMIEQGAQSGVLSAAESEVAQSVFRLADRRVGSLKTNRREIAWLDVDDPVEELRTVVAEAGHARYPLCEGSLDNVIGIIEAQTLLIHQLDGAPLDLRGAARLALFVPETLPAIQLLEMFHDNGQHMAIVVDEYGGTQGLITMADVLEAIVGDITEGMREDEPRATSRPDGSWLLDGMLSVEDFRDLFDLEELPGEEDYTFETLGGFVMAFLGRIPEIADTFEWSGLQLEVIDMDGRRVDKVLATPMGGATRPGRRDLNGTEQV
jgi:putative hemolysin